MRGRSRPASGSPPAQEQELVEVGFTRRKAEYAVAPRAERPRPRRRSLRSTTMRCVSAITALRGLGPWTAEWFLARHLARPRAWPAGDLALRKAATDLYGVEVHELGAAPRSLPESLGPLPPDRMAETARDDPPRDRGGRGGRPRALGGVRARGAGAGRVRAGDVGRGVGGHARRHRGRRRLPRARTARGRSASRRSSAPKRGAHARPARPRRAARAPAGRCEGAVARRVRRRDARARRDSIVRCDVLRRQRAGARAVWRRLGFESVSTFMAAPLDALDERLRRA